MHDNYIFRKHFDFCFTNVGLEKKHLNFTFIFTSWKSKMKIHCLKSASVSAKETFWLKGALDHCRARWSCHLLPHNSCCWTNSVAGLEFFRTNGYPNASPSIHRGHSKRKRNDCWRLIPCRSNDHCLRSAKNGVTKFFWNYSIKIYSLTEDTLILM